MNTQYAWLVPVIAGAIAILFSGYLVRDVMRRDAGTPAMQQIAGMIFEGATAFMRRQYRTIGMLAVVVAIVIAAILWAVESDFGLAWHTAIAFLVGAFLSALSGIISMFVAVKANVRTAAAAQRGLKEALAVSLRGGAVSGFLITALSILGVTVMYYGFGGNSDPTKAPFLIVGFAFGASFVALFSQLGGGIYTKAADMGADLVGKVEAGIPEDDPRNAGVIADLVGDNVGDCAGRGADLFESTAAENIGAMILGVAIFTATQNTAWVLFPLVIGGFGLIASLVGVMLARGKESDGPLLVMNRGYGVAVALSVIGMLVATLWLLGDSWGWFFAAGLVGIATSIAFVFITQYYTSGSWRPVRAIAEASRISPATNIVAGVSVGFETTFSTAVAIGAAILASYYLGQQAEFATIGGATINGGVFGTAVATMGMLMTGAYVLTLDAFGPITDNAGGIVEMSGSEGKVRDTTDALDSAGNTTKALTKGYALGSAGLAAFLLFSAYLDKVAEDRGARLAGVDLSKPEVFVAGLLAAMLVFLFSAFAIRAVGNAAGAVIEEVRRQFREHPGIMAGTERPDFARAVDITARAGLRGMVIPGALAVGVPVAVGLIIRVIRPEVAAEAMAGFLMVGTIAGILMATFFNNSGGAWDNAKKWIEAGNMTDDKGNKLGKRSDPHKSAVVGDTVGDPFKDTAGPSLHVLVKLLATVTLVLAPIFIVAA